jgi:acyl carrier protein
VPDVADVAERLTEVLRATFGDEALVIEPHMTADDVAGWDSVTHITLIYAIEDEFGMKFSSRDLEQLTCIGDIVAVVQRRA